MFEAVNKSLAEAVTKGVIEYLVEIEIKVDKESSLWSGQ